MRILAARIAPLLPVTLLVAACSGHAPPSPKTQIFESGVLTPGASTPGGTGPSDRKPFDPAGIGWVTAFRAEALGTGAGEKVEAGSWQSDLRLDNGTRLLVATWSSKEIRFPPGFALPLGQILRDVPETWRGTSVVAHQDGAGPIRLRTTIEYLPAVGKSEAPDVKRLYVLSLPVSETVGEAAEAAGEEPPLHWQVPPGQKITRKKYSYVVPVDSTVHYGVAELHDLAKYLRLTDTNDGKVLWEADPVVGPGTPHIATIPVYSSETGFPLYRDHEYEIEVLYDNPGPAPIDAMAVLYLYYRPPGTEEFSYPYPPGEHASLP